MSFARLEALNEFPFWLDLFHFYCRPLADSVAVCLGVLLSRTPQSFPQDSKKLFQANAEKFTQWGVGTTSQRLADAVATHREWFRLLRSSERDNDTTGSLKSIRDSRIHRLCSWQLGRQPSTEQPSEMEMTARLVGMSGDLSQLDGLQTAKRLIAGLCTFLNSLPHETWIEPRFEARDIMVYEVCQPTTFLPGLVI